MPVQWAGCGWRKEARSRDTAWLGEDLGAISGPRDCGLSLIGPERLKGRQGTTFLLSQYVCVCARAQACSWMYYVCVSVCMCACSWVSVCSMQHMYMYVEVWMYVPYPWTLVEARRKMLCPVLSLSILFPWDCLTKSGIMLIANTEILLPLPSLIHLSRGIQVWLYLAFLCVCWGSHSGPYTWAASYDYFSWSDACWGSSAANLCLVILEVFFPVWQCPHTHRVWRAGMRWDPPPKDTEILVFTFQSVGITEFSGPLSSLIFCAHSM